MKNEIKKTSKLLSLILRHQPEVADISLDEEGWANLSQLINNINQKFHPVDEALIQQVVATSDKQRFALSDDGTRIRANQGHSVSVDLKLSPLSPPEVLYHGTVSKFVQAIRSEGLQKMQRQHVHLSAEQRTATQVGGRRGVPVILTVQAQRMAQEGYQFYQSKNGVWLTEQVPADYIQFP